MPEHLVNINHKEFSTHVIDYIREGCFSEIINYCLKFSSISQLSALIGCSRKSIHRYKNGSRSMPIYVLKKIVQVFEIDENRLFEIMSDDNENYCNKFLPKTDDGLIIWYGARNDLFNSLYVYRKIIKPMSFFQLAYTTGINPKQIADYECGRKQIHSSDVEQILSTLNINIIELFPQLVSYDGGNSYVPLSPGRLWIDENTIWYDYYILENGFLCILPAWPINRYNALGKIQYTCMPNELSIDEYYNTDSIFFYNEDEAYDGSHSDENCDSSIQSIKNQMVDAFLSGPEVNIDLLPPNYYRYHIFFEERKNADIEITKPNFIPATSIMPLEKEKIQIIWKDNTSTTICLKSYIYSQSPWYRELKDTEYFKQCQLTFVKEDEETQIILWPNGQFIRIDEIPMDLHPDKATFRFVGAITLCGIDNWMLWK